MIERTLPSGASLQITIATLEEAKNLYQAFLSELQRLKVDSQDELDVNLFKDIFCIALSSKKIEDALKPCMRRALYKGSKIDDQSFEPVEAREDYVMACYEIARANIDPFAKSLYAELSPILAMLRAEKSPA